MPEQQKSIGWKFGEAGPFQIPAEKIIPHSEFLIPNSFSARSAEKEGSPGASPLRVSESMGSGSTDSGLSHGDLTPLTRFRARKTRGHIPHGVLNSGKK